MEFDKNTLLNAFTLNYLNVFIVDINKDLAKIVKLDGYVTDGMQNNDVFNYHQMLKTYADSRVYDEDKEMFMSQLSNDNIYEKLDTETQYEFTYRVWLDGEIHYYMAHYIRMSKKEGTIIAACGFRNIDALINIQNVKALEGVLKGYYAISNIFHALFRIDVTKNQYSIIKMSNSINEVMQKNFNTFGDAVKALSKELIIDPFRKEFEEFLDLSTISKRLKGKDYISIEFNTKSFGWCRGLIVREDDFSNGDCHHVIWATELIEPQRKREETLEKIAQNDQLTGIYNRGFGENSIEKNILKYQKGLFIIIDCDHFKAINDTYGHLAGDVVIKTLANVLQDTASKEDIVFRLGGDEFAIYSPNINTKDEAIRLSDEIIKNLNNTNIKEINGTKLFLSFGATFFIKDNNDNFSSLYKRADSAMYKSKKVEGFQINFE